MPPSHGGLARSEDTGLTGVRQEVPVSPVELDCPGSEIHPPGRRIWHIDSETEIVLDGPHEKRLSPELIFRFRCIQSARRESRMTLVILIRRQDVI